MEDLFLYSVIGIFGGVVLFVYGFIQLKKKRLIENIPTSKIRSMAMGLIEIKGRSVDWMPMIAPFSNQPSVYYRYVVEELRRTRKSTYWATIHKGDSGNRPFFVEDDTGRALINPEGANVEIPVGFSLRTGLLNEIPGHITQFLESKAVRYRSWFGISKTLRFSEHNITPNTALYIMGVCKSNRENLASEYRKRVYEVIKKVKAYPEVMKQFDTNNDGQISQEEWEMARQIIEQKTRDKMTEQEEKVYIGKGSHRGQMFYISDRNEKDLIANLSFSAFGGVFGGASLTLICLGYVLWVITHNRFS